MAHGCCASARRAGSWTRVTFIAPPPVEVAVVRVRRYCCSRCRSCRRNRPARIRALRVSPARAALAFVAARDVDVVLVGELLLVRDLLDDLFVVDAAFGGDALPAVDAELDLFLRRLEIVFRIDPLPPAALPQDLVVLGRQALSTRPRR
jgi:hypothetical protein